MHCTMGKDEYDKSQGGFLPPFSPEHVGNHVSVAQENPVYCGPPSDCKNQLVLNARQLSNEQRFDPCNKRISSNGGLYRRKPLDSDSPKSCPSDLSLETLGNTSEKTLRGDLASSGPEDSSDSEDLGFTTHRPNVNGFFESVTDTTAHDFRPGHRQGRKERNVSSFHKRKTDNFAKFREEEPWKSHHPTTATNNSMSRKGNSRPWPENPKYSSVQLSPPQRPNNFVQMQGEYALDDGSLPYHPPRHLQNYEQYVVPPNFAYTADDIYRNAFSVGSYPNLIAPKKVGHEMFSFVNALVSPPFFTPYQQPELAPPPPQCQYYAAAAVNPQDVRHRQSAQQAPREEAYATNNTVQPQTPTRLAAGFSSSYDDRLHRHHHHHHLGGGSDYSDQSLQVLAQENWLHNGINSASEEAFNSSLGSGVSCSNGKTIFRSRSLSAVEQSSQEAEHSVQADNYLSGLSSSSHHSNYGIAHMENALHNLSFGRSKSNARYPYPNGSVPPPANGNLQISREGLLTSNAHPNDSLVCGDHLQPAMSRHQDSAWSVQFSCAPERTVFAQPEFYEDDTGFVADTTNDVFWQPAADVNYLHSSSSSSSCPRLGFPAMSHKSVSYQDSTSQSFSQDENYLSFGVNKVGSSSDTEIYLKSTQSGPVHHLQSNCEYEDVAAPDAASTAQAVFVMDEEIFNSPDTNFQLPVPPLKLTDSSELNNHQCVRLNETEPQDHLPREQDGLVRPQGTRYTCAKGGSKKVRRKSGGGATAEVNQPMMNPNCHSNNLDFRPVGGVPVYRRHWEKSSTLWASYNCKDLNTFSSLSCQQPNKNKCKDFDSKHVANSPSNEPWNEQRKIGPLSGGGGHAKNSKKKNYPKKSQRFQAPRCLKPEGTPDSEKQTPLREDHEDSCVPGGCRLSVGVCESKLIKPENNDVYPWHHLPDEIWLNIFSYLGNHDRFQCSLLSKQFHRILQDESLWRHITLEKKMLQDDWLLRIAHLHPSTLELIQCHGDQVTAAGLSYLFKECTDSLLKLRFSRCSRGELTGDNILFASTVCRNLTHVDASWCTVTDSGLLAIAKSCDRLESLCLNGCGLIADNGLKTLATLHCKSLKELEMFGCFNITSHGIRYLASICRSLRTLQLGQCYKITDSCIAEVSSSLCCVENLDLRGCKQIKDTCIEKIVDNCSRLQTLALANCPNISNNAMQKIASTLPGIRSIDVCGCKRITDESVNRLAMNCRQLVYLDISSTGCTYKSVCRLAEEGSTDLETLKLNFITGITESSLTLLTKHCKSLTTLHLYGCKRVKNLEKLQALHPQLIIESDKD